MAFFKVTKNKAYYKRYQTKFRRRREAKTDYYARKNMIIQDLNKYVAPKYRLVARVTNNKVIAQIAYSTLIGDKVIAEANSKELKAFGLHNAFTSYSAAYATGLLLARRLLKTLKLDSVYTGIKKIDGSEYDVSSQLNQAKRPFMAILDIGIRRPTIGNRVFAVMKGACDGGVHIPHSTRKFPGYSKEAKKSDSKYDAKVHRDRIFGKHIDNYINYLQKEDQDSYKKQFALWIDSLKKSGSKSVEELFGKVFEGIRKNPDRVAAKKISKPAVYADKEKNVVKTSKGTYRRDRKLTLEQRKQRIAQKKQAVEKILKSK